MAAVTIPLSPHAIGTVMNSRRLALAENPNLGNSPYHRPAVTPVKRSRSHSNTEKTPPNKKRILEDKYAPKTPTRKTPPARVEKKVPVENKNVGRAVKHDRVEPDTQSLETVLQWQRHYRKMFPGYVFYFENIPEETRRRCVKGLESLGAREVKFFSKDVTHIITTRSVPSEEESSQIAEVASTAHQENMQPRTINPSLLEKNSENMLEVPKGKFNFDIASIRKGTTPLLEINNKRPIANKVDILQKAKELGIKVWQLEKLWRVLKTIFDNSQSTEGHATRTHAVAPSKTAKQVDLSQMIKNEQVHERGDREINAGAGELIRLTGPYIYVRCMNEKTKPIMVRQYPKVDRKEDGEWPQFRSASTGKCPFIEEDVSHKRIKEHREEKAKKTVEAPAETQITAPARVTRTAMQPPITRTRKEPLLQTAQTNSTRQTYQLPPPPARNDSTFTNGKDEQAVVSGARLIGGEPVASGVQPSNITSAIRSQMISSTAAGPGARAGTSKEIHGLQRKALERNTHGLRPSPRMTDIAGQYGRALAATRAARETATIRETEEEDEASTKSKPAQKSRRRPTVKEEKPGYCENCREKFADFEEHIHSRKHRKFAMDDTNFKELDALLARLVRPLKADMKPIDDDDDEN